MTKTTIRYHITFADDTGSRHAHAYASTYGGHVVSTTQNFDGEGHDLGVIEVDAEQGADIDQALDADDNVIEYR